nr:hypothetical protein RTCK_04052 [Rhizobium sp. TCK]
MKFTALLLLAALVSCATTDPANYEPPVTAPVYK